MSAASPPSVVPPAPMSRAAIAAWCLYDWANSSFPAVITTFVFATYFTQGVAPDPITGTALWSQALAAAGLAIAIASPILGAIADEAGRRKKWLAVFTALMVAAMALLWFVRPEPESVPLALIGIALATFAFEVATVFYNSLLPTLAPPSHQGRVSGWGWGFGYVGGIVCLALILFVFVRAEPAPFGLDRAAAEHVRVAALVAALWTALFAAPLFWLVPEARRAPVRMLDAARRGLADLLATARGLRHNAGVGWFLLAHMIYADGLTTLFAFGGIYAAGTFGMELDEVIVFGIALNVTAGAGALAFAWVDDWIGPRRTVAIALAALIVVAASLLAVESKSWFWGLGLALGVFFGPVQAASRTLMARLAPADQTSQYFGLFALSGRVTAFIGPAILGWVTLAFASQRAGMATILVFFAAGLWLLLAKVPDRRG